MKSQAEANTAFDSPSNIPAKWLHKSFSSVLWNLKEKRKHSRAMSLATFGLICYYLDKYIMSYGQLPTCI